MDGRMVDRYQEWAAEEWAGEDPTRSQDMRPRWTKYEWIGDQGRGTPREERTAAQMREGESGLSGFRHTTGSAYWVPPQ